jgi:hypothetical protein
MSGRRSLKELLEAADRIRFIASYMADEHAPVLMAYDAARKAIKEDTMNFEDQSEAECASGMDAVLAKEWDALKAEVGEQQNRLNNQAAWIAELKADNEQLTKQLAAERAVKTLNGRSADQLAEDNSRLRKYLDEHCDCPKVTRWKDGIDIQVKLHKRECDATRQVLTNDGKDSGVSVAGQCPKCGDWVSKCNCTVTRFDNK